MTAFFAYYRRRQIHALVGAAVLIASVAVAGPGCAAEPITVMLDQATITKLPGRVSTIVIGNPLIADVSVQAGGLLVVTGKGYGTTNLIALDRTGAVLTERSIEVVGAQDTVVFVYRGMNRESYSCAPNCERRITLGDGPEFFSQTLAQTATRASQAQAQGPAAR
jgi:Flp pilus assembly secretin CpaC